MSSQGSRARWASARRIIARSRSKTGEVLPEQMLGQKATGQNARRSRRRGRIGVGNRSAWRASAPEAALAYAQRATRSFRQAAGIVAHRGRRLRLADMATQIEAGAARPWHAAALRDAG